MNTKPKKIIYPTDFSVCADNALDYAVTMAKVLGGRIKTVHFLDMRETIHYDDNPISVQKEFELLETKTARRLKTRRKEILEKGIPCDYEILKTDRFSWLTSYVKEQHPDMVVMGTQGANIAENKIFGSETYKIIKNCAVPTLVVPEIAAYRELKKIIFATDYQKNDIEHLLHVAKIAAYFNAALEVVHVSERDFDKREYEKKVDDLKGEMVRRIGQNNIQYKLLHANNVADRLETLLKESGADLLALVARKRSFFDRLFSTSLTKRMVYHTHTPMLVF